MESSNVPLTPILPVSEPPTAETPGQTRSVIGDPDRMVHFAVGAEQIAPHVSYETDDDSDLESDAEFAVNMLHGSPLYENLQNTLARRMYDSERIFAGNMSRTVPRRLVELDAPSESSYSAAGSLGQMAPRTTNTDVRLAPSMGDIRIVSERSVAGDNTHSHSASLVATATEASLVHELRGQVAEMCEQMGRLGLSVARVQAQNTSLAKRLLVVPPPQPSPPGARYTGA